MNKWVKFQTPRQIPTIRHCRARDGLPSLGSMHTRAGRCLCCLWLVSRATIAACCARLSTFSSFGLSASISVAATGTAGAAARRPRRAHKRLRCWQHGTGGQRVLPHVPSMPAISTTLPKKPNPKTRRLSLVESTLIKLVWALLLLTTFLPTLPVAYPKVWFAMESRATISTWLFKIILLHLGRRIMEDPTLLIGLSFITKLSPWGECYQTYFSFRGLGFFWLVLQSLCSVLISFPLSDKGTHPLQAHIYKPAPEEASWIIPPCPLWSSLQAKYTTPWGLRYSFFPVVLVQQFSFPKALEDCLPSVGLPDPSPSPFLALLHPNMFGKISVAWWFTSGRYLKVSLPLPHLLFPLQHVY